MSIVSLSLVKQHLKVVGNAEDELIQLYVDSAETFLANYIGLKTFADPLPADIDPLPSDLRHAVLKLAAFHYEMRGIAAFGLSMQLAPAGVTTVADNYRAFLGQKRADVFTDDADG